MCLRGPPFYFCLFTCHQYFFTLLCFYYTIYLITIMSSSSENEFDIEGLSDITVDSDSDSHLSGDENNNAHDILTEFSDNLSEISVTPFTEEYRPSHNLPTTATELDFFNCLFTMAILNLLVHETNLYATQCILKQSGIYSMHIILRCDIHMHVV